MPETPLRLVIFDVDGTLIDSQAHILAAMRWAFDQAGRVPPPREETLSIVGLSLPEAMTQLAPDADRGEVLALVDHYKNSFSSLGRDRADAPFYPGARQAIDTIDAAGVLISAATGKSRRGLQRMLEMHELDHVFIGTQTADDAPSKPHPQMVLNCLAATGVEPAQAVMVGDTGFDMEMARAAGCRAIGVDWGYHPRHRLETAGAEVILDDFSQLIPHLEKIWGTV